MYSSSSNLVNLRSSVTVQDVLGW